MARILWLCRYFSITITLTVGMAFHTTLTFAQSSENKETNELHLRPAPTCNTNQNEAFPHENIRLPEDIAPLSYEVLLRPNLTTFKFSGRVRILLECLQPTQYVIFHIRDIHIDSITLTDSEKEHVDIARTLHNDKNQQFMVETHQELRRGDKYTLVMKYKGRMSSSMEGLYKSSYKTKHGHVRYLATTQFEATHARSAFPCFDEPAFKASFRISVLHDALHNALSNMPLLSRDVLPSGLVRSRFQESVKMSTYLIAVVVSDFSYRETKTKNGKKVRVWSRNDAINSTTFALDVAKTTLEYYEKFFNVSYPLPKLDLIAIPDMGGAMENWGLVTFRESALLFDSHTQSAADQQHVAMIVNHELAHQWFGNLVTMKWWNDLWLNEGFAVYMEYLASQNYQKKWRRLDQFVAETLQDALDSDSSSSTHPVSVDVQNPAQIQEIVDTITYHKGSSIIRMLHSFLGDDKFRKGIQIYLKKHEYRNAKSSDLWQAFTTVGGTPDVRRIMDSWATRSGYPVITLSNDPVQRKDGHRSLKARQMRFVKDLTTDDDLQDKEKAGFSWYIPLTYTTKTNTGRTRLLWMNNTSVRFQLPAFSGWIKANVGQTGFYRVNYDEGNWDKLVQQLRENHTVLSSADRSGLLDDSFSFARAGLMRYTKTFRVASYLYKENEYVPWAVALRLLAYIGKMFNSRKSYGHYQQYIRAQLKPVEVKLGWTDDGGILDKSLRELALSTLGFHGDKGVVEKALSMFRKWMETNGQHHEVPPHLCRAVYHTAIKHGGRAEWEFLFTMYRTCHKAADREKFIYGLSASQDRHLLYTLLRGSVDKDKTRTQDMVQILAAISGNPKGQLLAWKFYREHFKEIVNRVGEEAREIPFLLEKTTENLNTEDDLQGVKQFISTHGRVFSSLKTTKKIVKNIQANILWMKTHAADTEKCLLKLP